MKILLTAVLLSALFVSLSSAQEIGGLDLTSAGLGKVGTRALDTTNVVFVGDYKWVRVWATGLCDSCVVIAQKSAGGSSSHWMWAVKDSTVTSRAVAADTASVALYDSLYIDAKRNPKPPSQYMRFIFASRELNGAGRTLPYVNFSNVSIHIVGGR